MIQAILLFGMQKVQEQEYIKIGVIENDPDFRHHLTKQLNTFQNMASVEEWDSAELFLESDIANSLDLLLIDINLGAMNGI